MRRRVQPWLMKSACQTILLALASNAYAADPLAALPAKEFTGMGQLLQVTLGLFAVLAMILATAWIVRRTGAVRGIAGGQLRVLGALSMGQRERVVLIQVGETQLLVGIAPGQVRTLHVLDKPIVSDGANGCVVSALADDDASASAADSAGVKGKKMKPALFGNSFAAKLEAALSERMKK